MMAKAVEPKHIKDAEVRKQVRETEQPKHATDTEEPKQVKVAEEPKHDKKSEEPKHVKEPEEKAWIVLYPAEGQDDVPLAFPGGEEPNPLPEAKSGLGGYPITAEFSPGVSITEVTGELTDGPGKQIPVWLSSPEKPANRSFAPYQRNTVCLIAKDVLEPATRYTVNISAKVNEAAWSRKWTFQTQKKPATEKLIQEGVERINHYRHLAGLPHVSIHAKWSKECEAHARYLARNFDHSTTPPINRKDENPDLPGYSIEGREAMKKVIVSRGMTPLAFADWCVADYLNRAIVLDPRLKEIGLGAAKSQRQGWIVVFDFSRGRDGPPVTTPVIFPADGQTDVSLSYPSNSSVRPAPSGSDPGYAITAIIPALPVANVMARLTDSSGKEVDVWLSTPSNPAIKKLWQNSICLVPKKPLQPDTTYTVSVKALIRHRPWSQTWQFSTAAAIPQSSKKAVEAIILQQLNDYRKRAGLRPVMIDAALSKGCQLHARYLVKNAESPSVQGLGAHDEDPELPGYTQEGLVAGKTSVIAWPAHPEESVSIWMSTLYHRLPLLHPDLQRIGFGYCQFPNHRWICVMSVKSGKGAQ